MTENSSTIYSEIDIFIDGLTPCLVNRNTGEHVDTVMKRVHPKPGMFGDWNFEWFNPERQGYEVYALFIPDIPEAQGLIAFRSDEVNNAVEGHLMEANPKNVGGGGKFQGVGAHLTAFACKTASERGYNAYHFVAKTNLIAHYTKELGAVQIGNSQQMIIQGDAFIELIDRYYNKENDDEI